VDGFRPDCFWFVFLGHLRFWGVDGSKPRVDCLWDCVFFRVFVICRSAVGFGWSSLLESCLLFSRILDQIVWSQ
jgi:hypothetical protein